VREVLVERGLRCSRNIAGRIEIGFADLEVHDAASCAFELLRAHHQVDRAFVAKAGRRA
jgi:hypothetical protein